MKPPLFIECAVCGREFGSKSIQIHEPQCLQKLRRTEIGNREEEEEESHPASTTNNGNNGKKSRRKKKSERSVMVARASTSTAAATLVSTTPGTTILHHHSAPSFVLMATTASSSRFTSKFNLPKIQTSGNGGRPTTAVLDKPRILNPEYIQYDMSLTRIDFTGQHSSPPATTAITTGKTTAMDENQNGRLQRQNTQILDNSVRRHGFALPTVVDSLPNKHHRVSHKSVLDQRLPPPPANMVDAVLGDPQRQGRGDRGLMGLDTTMSLPRESGKRDDDDDDAHLCCNHTSPTSSSSTSSTSTTTVFTSLWSKEIYFMSTKTMPILPPLVFKTPSPPPSSSCSDRDNFPDCDPPRDTTPSPPVESLFAAPNFPFLTKLSHCDLEKPLRTCFHLDKIPRNAFELYQDNFVTPTASTEFPQLPKQQQYGQETEATTTTPAPFPQLEESAAGVSPEQGGVNAGAEFSPPDQPLCGIHTGRPGSNDVERQNDCFAGFQSTEVVVLKSVLSTNRNDNKSQNDLADFSKATEVVHHHPGNEATTDWIVKPFMQQHTYYTSPRAKAHETDTDSEAYATAIADSYDEHDLDFNSTRESLLGVMNELRQILERRQSFTMQSNPVSEQALAQSYDDEFSPTPPELGTSAAEIEGEEIFNPSKKLDTSLSGCAEETISATSTSQPHDNSETLLSPSSLIEGSTITIDSKCSIRTSSHQIHSNWRSYLRRKRSRERGCICAGSDADDESSPENGIHFRSRRRSRSSLQREKRLIRRYSHFKALHMAISPKLKPMASTNLISLDSEVEIAVPSSTRSEQEVIEENLPPQDSDSDLPNLENAAKINLKYPEHDNLKEILTDKEFPASNTHVSNHIESPLIGDGSIQDRADGRTDSKCSLQSQLKKEPVPSPEIQLDMFHVNHAEDPRNSFGPISTSELSGEDIPGNPREKSMSSNISGDEDFYETLLKTRESMKNLKAEQHSRSEGEQGGSDRRRRPSTKRPTTSGAISISDSVTMWEGSHIRPSNSVESEAAFTLPRPPTRRRDSKSRSISSDSRPRSQTVNSKIQNLISNVNRVDELHRERRRHEISQQQRRPKTVPASPYPTATGFYHPNTISRPSTSVPHAEMKRKSASGPKRKRRTSCSKSAAPSSKIITGSGKRSTEPSASIRIGLRNNRALTLHTSLADSFAVQDSTNANNKHSCFNEDEPLELLFSFRKKRTLSNKKKSPHELLSPIEMIRMDQAALYKQIERHRREAIADAHKPPARKRNQANQTSFSTSPCSSPIPSSGGSPAPASPKHTKPAKQVIKELRKAIKLRQAPTPPTRRTGSGKLKMPSKLASERDRRKQVPAPMSKRVTFSASPQHFAPSWKVPPPKRKILKRRSEAKIRISLKPPQVSGDQPLIVYPTAGLGSIKIRKMVGDAENCKAPSKILETSGEQSDSKQDKKQVAEKLDKMEVLRDKMRTKEFERRKRGRGSEKDHAKASVTTFYVPSRSTLISTDEKMMNVKIIVRRKNKDGSFPPIEEIVPNFSSNWNYLIVDEEPLTKNSPNTYEDTLANRAKTKAENPFALKITTSDQSTINSLASEEAVTRFLTCYVCGQSLNAREYFSHEAKCVRDLEEKNKFLADEDKRQLPQKPQGTITIKHWNDFAFDAVKDKYITCPFCTVQFIPENQEDVELHRLNCTNKPPPTPPPPRGIGNIDGITLEAALDSVGRAVPTSKEIRRYNWNKGYERVEQYSRPVSNRLRKYKKPRN